MLIVRKALLRRWKMEPGMFLLGGVYHPWGPPPVTLGTQNLYLFATGQRLIQRYLFPIYSFIHLSIHLDVAQDIASLFILLPQIAV